MATQTDLATLSTTHTGLVVTAYLPTSPSGAVTEEATTHLKVLRTQAHEALLARDMSEPEATQFLAPLVAMEGDRELWQHQQHGLAVFLSAHGVTTLSLADPVEPSVFVGEHVNLVPLLAHLQPEGDFFAIRLSQEAAEVSRGNHEGLTPVELTGMPAGIDGVLTDDDYENPAYAAPPARPNLGHHNISHAQVYGLAPPEWKKKLRERYIEQVASVLNSGITSTPQPTVLVADEELAGLLAARVTLSHIDHTHPESVSDQALHALAWSAVEPLLDQQRVNDVANFERVHGQGGAVSLNSQDTHQAATEGRVDVVFVTQESLAPELSSVVIAALAQGGRVVFAPELATTAPDGVAALLRYS